MPFDRMSQLSWIYDLYRMGHGAAHDTSAIYQQILAHIVDGFEAKSGSLALCGDEELTIVAGIDLPPGVIGSKVKIGEGVLGRVAQDGKPLLLNGDVSGDPRFRRHREAGRITQSHSSICWPLKIEERIIGGISVNRVVDAVVSMNRSANMPSFTEADMDEGTALLNMVSLVLTNIQLHIDRQRQLDALRQFKSVLDHTQDVIFFIDPETLRITYLSQSAESELGFSSDELLQMSPQQMDALMPYLAAMEMVEALRGGERENITLDAVCRRKDGGRFHVEMTLRFQTDGNGKGVLVAIVRNIEARKAAYEEQRRRYMEMKALNRQLEEAHYQLLQSEKMSSIGQLAAGVAHEINNPIGYVYSNLGTLEKYVQDAFGMLEKYEQAEAAIADPEARASLKTAREKLDFAFLREDLGALMRESKEGITRVKKIVQSLKDFSHVDTTDEWRFADLHAGLDSTLSIVNNEIKYKANVVREYGDIPQVECLPSQINQVFMNLLVNAAQAIEARGTITVSSGSRGEEVWVDVADTGKGIAPENMKKIFDPFFTTKPIGKGTGLGLSLSYSIVQKHHGRIEVHSEVGKGTVFRVWLPVKQPQDDA